MKVVESDLENQRLSDFEDLICSQLGDLFDVTYSYKPVQRTVRGKLMKIIQEVKI